MGVPNGISACLDRLSKYAAADPLTPYDKGPEQIINNGLLWDNPHSKCSIGSDQGARDKALALATAWQLKDAGTVRSTLDQVKAAAPATASTPPATHHRTMHKRTSSNKNKNAA